MAMQRALAKAKGWDKDRCPDHGHMSLLWSIEELGEAIAIFKKKGADAIMHNPEVRGHFVEECADTFMYLFDMMLSYGITAEEFTAAYTEKFRRNMGRDWNEVSLLYESTSAKMVIFHLSDHLLAQLTGRMVEVLGRTSLHLAIVSPWEKSDAAKKLESMDIDADKLDIFAEEEDAFQKAASKYGIAPQDAVVCTDTPCGIEWAKAAGMCCLAVTSSFAADLFHLLIT